MQDIIARPGETLVLGRLGENEHARILFDIRECIDDPDALVTLLHQPHDSETAYPVAGTVRSGDQLTWLVQSADLAVEGTGFCELVCSVGGEIAKSVIWRTQVLHALDGAGDPPEPWDEWQRTFTELKADAEAAAQEAQTAAQRVIDLGVSAETLEPGSDVSVEKMIDPDTGEITLHFGLTEGRPGAQGYSPSVEVVDIEGGHRVVIYDAEGGHVFDVMDGQKGDPGDPGQPGDKGDPGEGVPTGGAAGQVLTKGSSADYDTVWQDPAGGADWDAESGEDGYVANRPVYLGEADIDYITDEAIACATQSLDGVWWWSGYTSGTYVGEIPLDVLRDPDVTWVVTIDGARYTTKGQRQDQSVILGAESPGDPAVLTVGYSVQLAEINGQYGAVALLAVASDAAKTVDFSLGIVGSGTVVDPRYDLRADWDEADSNSFRYIRNKPSLIEDVQVNGSSVVQNGVANIPIGSTSQYGVYKVSNAYGTNVYNGCLQIMRASDASVKSGSGSGRPIVPDVQHAAAFYGLAKAAGDSTQSASSNAVGVYTESAKSAISQMLGGAISISGTVINLTAKAGVRYICIGDVSQLTFTPSETGICDVRFRSGSTPTVLTVPSTVLWPDWFDPSALEANTVYEINIMDGKYGAVAAWS